MARWIRFLFAILIGLAIGLAYGWFISPVEYVETSPHTLRIDYKADYVLMVAEAYRYEADLNLAAQRLALLGNLPPTEIVVQAIQFAQKYGYNDADIARMQVLWSALQSAGLSQGMAVP